MQRPRLTDEGGDADARRPGLRVLGFRGLGV